MFYRQGRKCSDMQSTGRAEIDQRRSLRKGEVLIEKIQLGHGYRQLLKVEEDS